jgi:hypothetical protein
MCLICSATWSAMNLANCGVNGVSFEDGAAFPLPICKLSFSDGFSSFF